MKVLMQIRKDVDKYPGGDFIQLLKTKEHLENLGVSVDISFTHQVDLTPYDLIHLFNVTRITETYLFLKNAKSQKKKVVLSPIYHPLKDMEDFYRYYYKFPLNIITYLAIKELYYSFRGKTPISLKSIFNYIQTVRKVLSESDILLPNSHLELESLEKETGVKNNYKIIPNASEINTTLSVNQENHKENLILCIGRIEPRKNPLNIINAFKQLNKELPDNTELVFIGSINESHKSYIKQFYKEIKTKQKNIKYIGHIPHEKVLLYLKRAQLLVLASFFETTGLVGLEALACKTNIVISERGYTKEYFKNTAFFCDPYLVDSIAIAMKQGFYKKNQAGLKKHFIENYTWPNVASLTLSAYHSLFT